MRGRKAARYLGGLVFCNLYRLLKIFPNNDPILGFALPFAKRDRWWHSALFAMAAMVSFDLITMRVGIWTVGTALAYGLVAALFGFYFKGKKDIGLKMYAKGSIAGVLIFDFLTGPIMSSLAFKIPFTVAFIGQVPFTIMHLASAVPLTILIATCVDPHLRASAQGLLVKSMHRAGMVFSRLQIR